MHISGTVVLLNQLRSDRFRGIGSFNGEKRNSKNVIDGGFLEEYPLYWDTNDEAWRSLVINLDHKTANIKYLLKISGVRLCEYITR